MEDKRIVIGFNAKIVPKAPVNKEFTLCRVYVMATGKNANMSHISKKAAENAMPTLFNIPVIGNLYKDDDGNYHMGGHDMTLERNEDGDYYFKSLCVPYGVVPSQENVSFEDIEEPNGKINTYLSADAILWTGRFPELKEAIYDENTYFGQSMEININDYKRLEDDSNYLDITDYSYSALCLLGKSDEAQYHVEPCFPMSRVEPYHFSADAQFSKFMQELVEGLKEASESIAEASVKGGKNMEDNKNENTPEPQSQEPVTDAKNASAQFSEENAGEPAADPAEPTAEPEEPAEPEEGSADPVKEPVSEPAAEPAAEPEEPEPQVDEATAYMLKRKEFARTYHEKFDALCRSFDDFLNGKSNRDANYMYGYIEDFDDKYCYVHVFYYDYTNESNDYKKFGRYAYVYDEDAGSVTFGDEFTELFVEWLTKEEVESLSAMREEYSALVEFKKTRLEEDHKAVIDGIISEFSYLDGNEEYRNVYDNRYSYKSEEDLRNACYIIMGKYSIVAPAKNNEPKSAINAFIGGNGEKTLSKRDELHMTYGKN